MPLYDGTLLASSYRQIVVVVNFRLGVFGFMSFWENGPTGGNYGLLDQQEAISFIKRNAAKLQGDENRITIFGESSGASEVGYHLLNKKSTSMISNAIMESGCYWWYAHSISRSEEINTVVSNICREIDACTVGDSIQETIKNLRAFDDMTVFWASKKVGTTFYPVFQDGIFFEEYAQDIHEQCKVQFDGSIITGANSFEGSLMYNGWEPTRFKPNEIRNVFRWLADIGDVPLWQQEFIIEKYFEIYRDYFSYAPHYRFLNTDDAYMIYSLIYGDFGFRRPSLLQSKQYQNCGSKVYSYYLDVETQWDLVTQKKLYFNGTGHGYEELHTWGATELGTYPELMNGLEPEQWEYDMTFIFQSQWSRIGFA